jgi:hypothetical protein
MTCCYSECKRIAHDIFKGPQGHAELYTEACTARPILEDYERIAMTNALTLAAAGSAHTKLLKVER